MHEKLIKKLYFQTKRKQKKLNYKFNIFIYYKRTKRKSYIKKNNLNNNTILLMSNVIYKINCPLEDYEHSKPFFIIDVKKTLWGNLNLKKDINTNILENINLRPFVFCI